ncbi:hypothetical protein JVT61DRAFT_4281 [Boletus reticuloceps]|uniref:Uncharacterized protein n=1 Tax=Boletus reticuloceps TaxID=495285 RepID=A0A8I2YLU4_9AGAM|nr:hypothetical protein JVT61DRAFT_4281 [Boletus reticuloceps]
MSINELLNPATESYNMFDAMDEDIYESVMHAKALWDSGSNDDNNNNESGGEPTPTRMEALQAVLTLRRYVNIFNNPLSQKLEMTLGSFGQQTRVIEMQGKADTRIADYLSRVALQLLEIISMGIEVPG